MYCYKFALLLLITFFSTDIFGQEVSQKSWRRLISEAEEFETLGDLSRAAIYYEAAYKQKEDRKDLIYKAGTFYLETRDYNKAVKCLEEVKDREQDTLIKIPGFKYASALKQLGLYQEAKDAYAEFINIYKGNDKEKMQTIADLEILGCDFAIKSQETTNKEIKVKHLSGGINSERTEFAPIPFEKNILYFSSTSSGVAKIYRSQRNPDGSWSIPQVPSIFVKMEKTHFGNGSFTPDGNSFYFTQCEVIEKGKTKCQIYVMTKEGEKWSIPVKLPDFINSAGSTATHPCVTVQDGKEILYFASDREGGKGGMDLWFCTKDRNSRDAFTLPKNLGTNINTWNDEVTPFYNSASKTLFFSSNGRNSAGGLDIYKSVGEQLKWDFPQNMGFPINSSADDLYYIVNEAHGGGYLVSNRIFDNSKFSTTDDDIFFFSEQKKQLLLKGTVFSEKDISKTPLREVNIKIFELIDGSEELIIDKNFAPAKEYSFVLEPNKDFVMEVNAGGFMTNTSNISTKAVTTQETRIKDIAMRVPEEMVKTEPKYIVVPARHNSKETAYLLPAAQPVNPKTGLPYDESTEVYKAFKDASAVAQKSDVKMVYWSNGVLVPYIKDISAIKKPGVDNNKNNVVIKEPEKNKISNTSYKIQVAAVRKFREYMYDELQEGELKKYKLVFEDIEGGMTRILISPKTKNSDGTEGFQDRKEILKMLEYLIDHTRFKTSFISKYENNSRVGGRIKGFTEDGSEVEEP